MSVFDEFNDLGDAVVYGDGVYIIPGKYLLEVKDCKYFNSQKDGKKHEFFFVVEFIIHRAKGQDRFEVGDEISWMVEMRHGKTAKSNIKAFLQAMLPDDPTSFNGETMRAVCEDNALEGLLVDAYAFQITTNEGNPFTKVKWTPVGDDEE